MRKRQCVVAAVAALVFSEAVVVAQVDVCSVEEGAPTLLNVMNNLGDPRGEGKFHTFISPLGEGESARFEGFSFLASEDVTLDSYYVSHTAPGPAPGIVNEEVTKHGNGLHWVQFTEPLAPGHWVEVQLNVRSQSSSLPARFDLWLAHQPLDINQDGCTNVRDATAFGVEFRGDRRAALIDVDGNGSVDVRDATAFGDHWFGRLPATQVWGTTRCLDTIRSSEWLTGFINLGGQDFYTFTGQVGQRIFLQAIRTSGEFVPWICLIAPSDVVEVCSGTNSPITAIFDHTLKEEGPYEVRLRDPEGDQGGGYLLALLSLSGPLTSPQDSDGGAIAFGETRCGAIDTPVDNDAYTFTGQAGQRIFLQANRTSGGVGPQMCLYPPSGGDVEVCSGSGAITAIFSHILAESGRYTMLLRDPQGDEDGDYLFSLQSLSEPVPTPIRFGDTIAAAIDSVVDMDTYTFEGLVGQRISLRAERTSGAFNPQICLYPPSGGDGSCVEQPDNTAFDHTLAEEGLYTILLRDPQGDGVGDYLLSLLRG